MPNEKKSIYIIEFFGEKADCESWFEKFLLNYKHKWYKKLLESSGSTSGVDKIPAQEEYENALKGDMDLNKKIIKLGELNEVAYCNLILSIKFLSGKGSLWTDQKCQKFAVSGRKL